MSSLSKKLQRKKEKAAKKELKKKIGLFNKLADHCLVCRKSFDKKNKDMVMSWSVVVKYDEGSKEDKVRLYCPECWGRANELIEQLREGLDEQN